MVYLQFHILECKKEFALIFVSQNSFLIVEIKINYKLTGREYFDSVFWLFLLNGLITLMNGLITTYI